MENTEKTITLKVVVAKDNLGHTYISTEYDKESLNDISLALLGDWALRDLARMTAEYVAARSEDPEAEIDKFAEKVRQMSKDKYAPKNPRHKKETYN